MSSLIPFGLCVCASQNAIYALQSPTSTVLPTSHQFPRRNLTSPVKVIIGKSITPLISQSNIALSCDLMNRVLNTEPS
ncbi:hypothetical protein G7K_5567-t1 [Saitoella complicata NRRL Y-17804]|uniref:Uncharacterized protein n=1 Tax=Saitoella complicata (strain BCRC 22490 / CBS 7301 / JCM 7358 / NBRC 10748 / NRRL Y-17804) TaxID=698492 RepID=A0A0E9NNL8_SAICN|nr:hypothetical protein G7K_5567-t1 [Saitoella complicata NRRL Y-17804]